MKVFCLRIIISTELYFIGFLMTGLYINTKMAKTLGNHTMTIETKNALLVGVLLLAFTSCGYKSEPRQYIRHISDESDFYYSWQDVTPTKNRTGKQGHWELRRIPIDTTLILLKTEK